MADRTITYRFRGDASGLKSATRSAGNDVRGLGNQLQAAGRHTDSLGKRARHLIPAFGAGMAALGVGKLVKDSVQLEASFSKTLTKIAVATNAPKSAMKGLHDTAMKMGAQTVFSANEAADAMLELAKSGISTRDIMGGGIKGTLTLAAAGDLDLASAATIAANAMNTFGLAGKDMGSIAAALAGGANASTASVGSLGQALAQVGPGAKNAGMSLQETVGTLAEFDQYGIKGSDAGTSLKTMLARLVPSTKQAKTAMKDLNLSFVDSKGNIDGITTVAQKLHDKLGPLTQAQRIQALTTIFGSDATRAATVLMNHGAKGLEKFIRATKDQGAAQKMANANMSGTAGALEQLSGAWETTQLKLGEALAPTIQKGAKYLSSVALPAVTKFIGQMQSGTGTGGAVARDLGTIYNAAKKVVDIGGQVARAFDGLPGGLKKAIAIGGIGALAANKLGLIGRGSLGSAVARSVTGGVQKVFVVNMGAAGVGGVAAGAEGAAAARAAGRGALVGATVKSIALRAGAVYVAAGVLGKLNFGDKGIKGDARAVLNSTKHPGATALDQKLAAPFGGDALTKQIANMKKLDDAIAKVTWSKPAAGAKRFRDVMRQTGLSSAQLGRVLPATAQAMDAVGRGGQAGSKGLAQLLGGAKRTSSALHSLPKAVRTAVTTPGAVKSLGDIQRLTTRYKLTPKQVRTLASLSDHASGPIKTVNGRIVKLGAQRAKPVATLVDRASGGAARIRGEIAGIHGKSITIAINTVHTTRQITLNPSLNKPRGIPSAAGNIFGAYAAGDVPNGHQPELVRQPTYRMWAEPETKGEAYIPLANDWRRPRAVAIWQQTGRLLDQFAAGGTRGARHPGPRQQFDLFGGITMAGVRREFKQLEKALGHTSKRLAGLEGVALRVSHAYNLQEKQLKRVQAKSRDLSNTTQTAFTNDPFGNGLTGLGDVLEQDKHNAMNMATSLKRLKRKGISRGLEAALAASGDSATAMELAKLSRSQINRYDTMFAQRNKAADWAGDVAARNVYGGQIRHLNRTLNHLDKRLNGIEKAAERGTAKGTRQGMNDKSRSSARKRRVRR